MQIVLATPLYPPDIADPAPYTFELAKRLSKKHKVHVVAYGRFPEMLDGVQVSIVDKRLPTWKRALHFRDALKEALSDADILYIQSGISAELPALLVRHKAKSWWRESKEPAHQSLLRRTVKYFITRTARVIPRSPDLERPEILPLEERRDEVLLTWEKEWNMHIAALESYERN